MSDVNATLTDRDSRYGKLSETATIVRRIEDTFEDTRRWAVLPDGQRHALRMIAVKLARILNGEPSNPDSWHDLAGYATLGERECVGRT